MKRRTIKIDEEKCNGCGQCIPGCPEGAIQIIDEKARLVSDLFCDGLGACIGSCPLGAIAIEEREAQEYDERELSSLRSLTSPEGLHGPMALRNPACPCGTRKRAPTPWPGRRIASLSPLKGAYPLQTTPDVSEFLRNSET